jgi:hypothetical protein
MEGKKLILRHVRKMQGWRFLEQPCQEKDWVTVKEWKNRPESPYLRPIMDQKCLLRHWKKCESDCSIFGKV